MNRVQKIKIRKMPTLGQSNYLQYTQSLKNAKHIPFSPLIH